VREELPEKSALEAFVGLRLLEFRSAFLALSHVVFDARNINLFWFMCAAFAAGVFGAIAPSPASGYLRKFFVIKLDALIKRVPMQVLDRH
jgi:hypothetical protein